MAVGIFVNAAYRGFLFDNGPFAHLCRPIYSHLQVMVQRNFRLIDDLHRWKCLLFTLKGNVCQIRFKRIICPPPMLKRTSYWHKLAPKEPIRLRLARNCLMLNVFLSLYLSVIFAFHVPIEHSRRDVPFVQDSHHRVNCVTFAGLLQDRFYLPSGRLFLKQGLVPICFLGVKSGE